MINEPKLVEIYSKTFYEDEYVAELKLINSNQIVGYISEKGIISIDLESVDQEIINDIVSSLDWVLEVCKSLK